MTDFISRSYPAEVEVRRGSKREVTAYAAIYGTEAEIRDAHGHYREVIRSGAFRDSLAKGFGNVTVFYNHGYNAAGQPDGLLSVPIGSPVDIREDRKGLLTITRFNDGPVAEQTLAAIRAGDIRGFSFRGPVYESFPSRVPTIRRGGELPLIERRRLGLVEYGPTKTPFYEGAAVVAVRARTGMDDPVEPYGDVEYADPGYQPDGVKRYPLDTERHVRAAWSYIHQGDNADRYTPEQLRRIKQRIRKAGEEFGITFREDSMRSQIAIASPSLTQDEAVKLATQFGRILDVATEEPVLMRSLAASVSWRSPNTLDTIEQSLRTIALTATSERYQDIQAERSIIRARLEELAEEGDPDTDDEDEYEQVLAERVDEIDDLVARDEELAEEEADLLYGDDDVSDVDEEDEAYAYA